MRKTEAASLASILKGLGHAVDVIPLYDDGEFGVVLDKDDGGTVLFTATFVAEFANREQVTRALIEGWDEETTIRLGDPDAGPRPAIY